MSQYIVFVLLVFLSCGRIWASQNLSVPAAAEYSTVRYTIKPLPPQKTSYRLPLGEITLHVSDFDVYFDDQHAKSYEKKVYQKPTYSLIHSNCSEQTHWVSFSSRRARGIQPFIKFGYGEPLTQNTLFHFVSKINGSRDDTLHAITLSVEDEISIVGIPRYYRRPVVADAKPFIDPHSRRGFVELMQEIQAGPVLGELVEDVTAFTLTQDQLDAINYSLETAGCTLANIISNKTMAMRDNVEKFYHYIRFLGSNQTGGRMTLEVWPKGHHSSVHNHAYMTEVIKVLQGPIKLEWYNPIVNACYDQPVMFRSEELHAGNISWKIPDLYQTRKLYNVNPEKAAITVQAYRYDDEQSWEGYFAFVKPNSTSPYLGRFFPTTDLMMEEITTPQGKIIQEFRNKRCESEGSA